VPDLVRLKQQEARQRLPPGRKQPVDWWCASAPSVRRRGHPPPTGPVQTIDAAPSCPSRIPIRPPAVAATDRGRRDWRLASGDAKRAKSIGVRTGHRSSLWPGQAYQRTLQGHFILLACCMQEQKKSILTA